MKKFILSLFSIIAINCSSQNTTLKNENLQNVILKKYPEIDINKNGRIEKNEAENVKNLNLMEMNLTNINGIAIFKNLEYLYLTINKIEKLKLNDFPNLEKLYVARNKLKSLEISNMPKLKEFACGINELEKIRIKNCPNIESLNFMDNKISEIDLKDFPKLKYLSADHNKLTKIDFTKNPELIQFLIHGNQIKEIDISQNPNLKLNILYIDKTVKINGSDKQINNYTPVSSPPPPM
ncbi:leucine-rich repeat domain-containing protein [Chryseobacterium sp. MP_3.2]|uniref:leucine-rich repeat domain-containing protein n=1 Tax=Chryseobacterium sp. MP_3.2 TaxID=3071712 RepID=UPI002DFDCBFD|nr:Leucine-rich repeat (LRR) protein [Chryseobacterium sp. MP_3.2]